MKNFAESEIQKMMTKLDLSREEAIQLLQDDEDDVSVELTNEQKKVAKQMAGNNRKKETAPRRRTHKVDETKRRLLNDVRVLIEGLGGQTIEIKAETDYEFWFEGASYNLRLVKHREKKAA